MLHELVELNVVQQQLAELSKALYGMGEYRLAAPYDHLQKNPVQWKTMKPAQRQQYLDKILGCTAAVCDTYNPKYPETTRKLSIQPDKCSAMNNLPLGTVQRLWQSAESILQHYGIKELESGDFVVCEYDKASIIRKTSGGLICECMDFKSGLGICVHVLATSETRGQLPDLLERYSYNPSQAMHKQRKKGAGEK